MLHFLNYYVFQWFFFRIARKTGLENERIGWTVILARPLSGYNGRPWKYLFKNG